MTQAQTRRMGVAIRPKGICSRSTESEREYVQPNKRTRVYASKADLVSKYKEILDNGSGIITYYEGEKCRIKTKRGEKVVKRGQMIPQSLKEKTKAHLEDLERRRSVSEWGNPIRAIERPNVEVRVVSNLMALNDLVEKDPYQFPGIREIIRATQGSRWFTVIDLKEGFYHIEIEEEDKHKTAFEYDGRVYEWNSMVMGFKNAPQIMQRVINRILEDIRGQGVVVYMDDIVIHAGKVTDHDRLLNEVMERFWKNQMKINPEKIQYRSQEEKLLGVAVNGTVLRPLEIKKNEALAYERPQNKQELRRFLGLAGWFGEFIQNYAIHTVNLAESLRKDKGWLWTEEMESEFTALKEALRHAKELKLPDYKQDFRLRTDACNTGYLRCYYRKTAGEDGCLCNGRRRSSLPQKGGMGSQRKKCTRCSGELRNLSTSCGEESSI